MKPTDITHPDYFHKVVDCQWACPAHTPVPEYIRLIADKRYTDAFMINWKSNVFPGILGRTCDRPCEPACRRGRVEDAEGKPEPVAICRLKRVAADNKGEGVEALMPAAGQEEKRQARRLHWRGTGFADGGARSAAARLRGAPLRWRRQSRRHDPHANPALSFAGKRDRRRGWLYPRARAGAAFWRAGGEPESVSGARLGRGVRRHRRAARARPRSARAQGSRAPTSISASIGCPAFRSSMSRTSASA